MESFIGKIMPKTLKQKLVFQINKWQWQKRQYPKLKEALKDDTIGYVSRKLGIDRKFAAFKAMKNKYEGERCFIIATGPSLRMEDVELLKNEYTFGVNSLVKVFDQMSYIPTFYVIQDGLVYEKIRDDIKRAKFHMAFIGDWKMKKEFFNDHEWIQFPYSVWSYFTSYPEGNYVDKVKFTDNAYLRVYNGFSVTYSAIQIATYLGFKEIYLLGNDCNYEKGVKNFADYRSEKEIKNTGNNGENMVLAYDVAKEWADKNHIKIYNATRGGMLEAFERVKLEDISGLTNAKENS